MLTDVTESPGGSSEAAFQVAIAAVRASDVLGRSRLLHGFFDYLAARAFEARPPKESEIAHEVFGLAADFEAGQNSIVRVYAHRLRRKLEAFAEGAGAASPWRLGLPPGEYRLILTPASAEPVATATARSGAKTLRRWLAVLIGGLALVSLAGWGGFRLAREAAPTAQALRSPVWRPFAASHRPLLIVVGDYYILGESDDGFEISRLVREYKINSAADLDTYLIDHPDRMDRYQDLGLSYLPTSSAAGVSAVSALFAGRKPVSVITASKFTPDMMKDHDLIYIGYLSGLGVLNGSVFAGSRFRMGDSFDDITDRTTGRRYSSQAALGPVRGAVYHDYGYVAVFQGPAGNPVAVIAGARDIGAMAAAEQLTDPKGLRALERAVGARGVEALYEVQGQGAVNYQARLVSASPRLAQRTP